MFGDHDKMSRDTHLSLMTHQELGVVPCTYVVKQGLTCSCSGHGRNCLITSSQMLSSSLRAAVRKRVKMKETFPARAPLLHPVKKTRSGPVELSLLLVLRTTTAAHSPLETTPQDVISNKPFQCQHVCIHTSACQQ